MTDQANASPSYQGPALFSYGFRPFFLGAALFAGVAVPVWILVLAGVDDSTFLYPARDWHVHEMVFGFLPAVITGFLLTAIPNWTDRPPIRGYELMLLSILWLAGRLLIAMPWFTPLVSAIVDA
ncbi:MAG: NnrS family protein, partial [Nitrospiraceae bacterium]